MSKTGFNNRNEFLSFQLFGNKNESWDRLLNRMMDELEKKELK